MISNQSLKKMNEKQFSSKGGNINDKIMLILNPHAEFKLTFKSSRHETCMQNNDLN